MGGSTQKSIAVLAAVAIALLAPAWIGSTVLAAPAQEHGEQETTAGEHNAESALEPAGQDPDGQEGAEAHTTDGAQEPPPDDHATDEHAAADDEHGAAGEHGEEHEETSWAEYAMKWTNFVLLLGLLYWLLVVPPAFVRENFEFDGLKEVLANRSQSILAASSLAKEQRQEAERADRESAERLAAIEQEADQLVVSAREEAELDRGRIAAAAQGEAEKIRGGASRDMNAEVGRARRALRAHVADLAVSIATEMVRENISADDQDRMVRRYLDRLGESVS